MNYNVKLVFLFSIFQSFGRGIWMGNVLSAYIFFIAGESNELLGWTSAASGVAMTILVFPSGYFADKFRRDLLLKIAGVFGIVTVLLLILGNDILFIFIALAFWGFFQALPGYYAKMREMHSQMVNDYIYWFVIVLAIVLVVVGVT